VKTTAPPNLADYDVILVNSSGGKDSQCMLDVVTEEARARGVADRIVVVHADLGRAEWRGTRELAQEQAEHYGHRFEVVARGQDLLDHVQQRRMWPSAKARYCTSDHKRDQVKKLMTGLANEHHGNKRGPVAGPCRILNCMGMRASESAARAKRVAFRADAVSSNGRRHVDEWLPIFYWSEAQVWDRIRQSGVRHHDAYDLGMSRLSCALCVFASRDDLLIAGENNRELLAEYVRVEAEIGHSFRHNDPISNVLAALDRGERGTPHCGSPCGSCGSCDADGGAE
jgi:3'-phosphoadenosine 5'-phosphosulfate sulfotransferase (PAPS reductase)/FAD synthetase